MINKFVVLGIGIFVAGLVVLAIVYMVSQPSATNESQPSTTNKPTNQATQTITPTTTQTTESSNVITTTQSTIRGEVWADNWFSLYADGKLVAEDSVPITTERSFNSETFTFTSTYPIQLAFIVKDFKENDTGLEYIRSNRQQMGDGGFIAQFTDTTTGKKVGVTDSSVVCQVIHHAPTSKSCAKESNPVAGSGACGFTSLSEPTGWKNASYNDSAWPAAIEYSEAAVSPKDGYNEINWATTAKLIWGSDLEQDNTLLCRLTLISS